MRSADKHTAAGQGNQTEPCRFAAVRHGATCDRYEAPTLWCDACWPRLSVERLSERQIASYAKAAKAADERIGPCIWQVCWRHSVGGESCGALWDRRAADWIAQLLRDAGCLDVRVRKTNLEGCEDCGTPLIGPHEGDKWCPLCEGSRT